VVPLKFPFSNWASPLSSWAQLAFRGLGIADAHSLIEGELIGSQYCPLTINPLDQMRSSSQTSFLSRAFEERKSATRSNLKVYTHTLTERILIDSNKTAAGVSVHSGPSQDPPFILSARKEVIVSAGAFQSPQLLVVSDIGPVETLAQHNIPVIANRPGVGQNMWHHVLSIGRRVGLETSGSLMNAFYAASAEEAYAQRQEGILTNDMSEYLGWENLPSSLLSNSTLRALEAFPKDWPHVEYEITSAPFGMPSFSTSEDPIDVGYIQPVLLTPFSRGNVSISSMDMSGPPLINPNWLTHPVDQIVAVAASKRARALFNTTAISPILIGPELLPGQDLPSDSTDSEILSYIQANIGFNWHASCTCKMGREDDVMAVLDSKARVRGVSGLRVVDASSMPVLTPEHPMATVYALAEKIAVYVLGG
jgi:choline dehydrogenase